jgi:hypothetical protein
MQKLTVAGKKKTNISFVCLSVRPFVSPSIRQSNRMEHFDYHRTDLHEK